MPWKYGFKSIKSIVRFSFTDQRPKSYWEDLQSSEYGFWANVNPEVSHPRWSQATEEILGTGGERKPTLLFNGYGEYVAGLYKGLESRAAVGVSQVAKNNSSAAIRPRRFSANAQRKKPGP